MDPAKDMLEETQHELERAYATLCAKQREVAEAMKSLNLAIARATSLMAMVKTKKGSA